MRFVRVQGQIINTAQIVKMGLHTGCEWGDQYYWEIRICLAGGEEISRSVRNEKEGEEIMQRIIGPRATLENFDDL